jgi:hypothetical protein
VTERGGSAQAIGRFIARPKEVQGTVYGPPAVRYQHAIGAFQSSFPTKTDSCPTASISSVEDVFVDITAHGVVINFP